MEASIYMAYRSAGKSIEDAKRLSLNDDGVVDSLTELHDAQREMSKTKAGLDRAIAARHLYQTTRADRRGV